MRAGDEPRDVPASTLEAAVASVVDAERLRVFAVAASVRLAGAVLFAVLTTVLWRGFGHSDWGVYAPILATYTGLAALVWRMRQHPLAKHLRAAAALLDIGAIYLLQHTTMPVSPSAPGVAGFSLGLFALLISLSGLSLSTLALTGTTLAAMGAQAALMREAQVGGGAIVAAALVLGLTALVTVFALRRLVHLAMGLSRTDRERVLESRRAEKSEETSRVIQRLLDEATTRTEALTRLQRDKDHMTQLLVHDLRTPLTAVMATLDLVRLRLRQTESAPDIQDLCRRAVDSTERLAQMTDEILQVAKLEDGKLKANAVATPMRVFLERVLAGARPLAEQRAAHLGLEVDEGLAGKVDPALMARVLENLVSNGLRYVPDQGGKVLLVAKAIPEGIQIAVHNNGPAIEPERRTRIFEKFEQGSERRRGGFGLGLYFCRLAIEAHYGHVEATQVPPWTCSFVIELPERPTEASPATPAAHAIV